MQENGWDKLDNSKKGDLKKVYGMQKSIREGNFHHNGWPQGHVLSILWGSTSKLLTAMGHDKMCEFCTSSMHKQLVVLEAGSV